MIKHLYAALSIYRPMDSHRVKYFNPLALRKMSKARCRLIQDFVSKKTGMKYSACRAQRRIHASPRRLAVEDRLSMALVHFKIPHQLTSKQAPLVRRPWKAPIRILTTYLNHPSLITLNRKALNRNTNRRIFQFPLRSLRSILNPRPPCLSVDWLSIFLCFSVTFPLLRIVIPRR